MVSPRAISRFPTDSHCFWVHISVLKGLCWFEALPPVYGLLNSAERFLRNRSTTFSVISMGESCVTIAASAS
eukprot:9486407-Pyramimonas_sp.AAC.1